MRIGDVEIGFPAVLAPLAGVTDLPFRRVAKRFGAGLVASEMVSANALVRGQEKTLRMIRIHADERPVSIQIFGADPETLAGAAAIVEAAGADILDLNLGCAVKKIVKSGYGAALMRAPDRAEAIFRAVRKKIRIPFTIKIRTGWNLSGEQAFTIAKMAEACGVDAIAVHPRTAGQGFSGVADWGIISAIGRLVSIPVIGNGDIRTPEDASRMVSETGCSAVMLGRAAVMKPWIFTQIRQLMETGAYAGPCLSERFDMMRHYVDAMVEHYGEAHACRMLRSRLCWLAKGFQSAGRFREQIKHLASRAEAMERIDTHEAYLISQAS